MNILFLPGMAQMTVAWGQKLLDELALGDGRLTIQHYAHWEKAADSQLRLEEEIEKLRGLEVDLLVAKSIGVVVGLNAVRQGLIAPKKAIFIGTPVLACAERKVDLQRLAGELRVPALYLQQKDDVVGSSGTLCREVGTASLATIVEVPGNNHQYKDIKLLCRHIHPWLDAK